MTCNFYYVYFKTLWYIQSRLPVYWTHSNVPLTVFSVTYFSNRRKNGHSVIKILSLWPQWTVQQGIGMGTWLQWRIFFVLSDCGKISLLYSDIFPFFSYNEERDWWRKQQKKNNYRQREGTTTQNSIMLFRRVNHFRKGSEDKPFYFNSSLRWYFPPQNRKEL